MPLSRGGHLTNLVDVETARAPLIALATDYPPGHHIPLHRHDRGQLLHALTGVVVVETAAGRWIVPPDHALWIPAQRDHAVDAIGLVRRRSVYVRADRTSSLPRRLVVLGMEPLMRAMIVEAVALADSGPAGPEAYRDRLLLDLLLAEIPRLEERPLALPMPQDPRLAQLCHAHLSDPAAGLRVDVWAETAGMSRRSLTRRFRAETGIAIDVWRRQAALFAALPRLAQGVPVTEVALDLGYDSPAAFSTMFRKVLGASPRAYLGTAGIRPGGS